MESRLAFIKDVMRISNRVLNKNRQIYWCTSFDLDSLENDIKAQSQRSLKVKKCDVKSEDKK
jgi:hypothetical protein